MLKLQKYLNNLWLKAKIKLPRIGYSERIKRGYGLVALRNEREAKALRDFCKKSIEDSIYTEYCRLNPLKCEVFRKYITLYDITHGKVKFNDDFVQIRNESDEYLRNKRYYSIEELVTCYFGIFWS